MKPLRKAVQVLLASAGIGASVLLLNACTSALAEPSPERTTVPVAGAQWTVTGGDTAGTWFSSLTDINETNAASLGFAWAYDMGAERGQEATPLVIDGVMYTSGIWGNVYALDATSGKLLWQYDPQVDGQWGRNACCDVVNRGIAYRDGVVFVASEDGRLHAIDAKTGEARWTADTIVNHKQPYASTGAVILTRDAVVIGNAGADIGDGALRGYISAWDIKTGAFKWRFFTVPPAPGQPFEHPELEMAAKSWAPNRDGHTQNGGTVWDGLSYDPETDQIVFGTGNASPYLRSADGKRHDDLFNASIIAVSAQTGRMNWYYQTTPGDEWDYDAVQKFIFANLPVGGQTRRVVMQACKNGFFYTLDLKTGKLLAADPFTYVNWAKGVDLASGRPMVTEQADYSRTPRNVYPSWAGGHTWNPMSFSPQTGLVYIPAIDAGNVLVNMKANGGSINHLEGFFSSDGVFPDDLYDPAALKRTLGPLPAKADLQKERPGVKLVREVLRAWDPVAKKVVWEQTTSQGVRGYDGGVLSTAGNLVFQGRGDGSLWIYNARTGAPIKTIQTGSHIMAAPMTYKVGGVQYVAVQAGYGGSGISFPIPASSAAYANRNTNRILVFKLGGAAVPMPDKRDDIPYPAPPPFKSTPAMIAQGEDAFTENCSRCHVLGTPGLTPDLTRLPNEVHSAFNDIVLKGALAPMGMGRFDDLVTKADVEAIHAYLIDQQRQGYKAQRSAKKASH
jgi:quinohemoprotein ethanol dehydrogenase